MGKRLIVIGAITAFLTLMLSGCSLIGLGVGLVADASKPHEVYVPADRAETLKTGQTILISRINKRTIIGKYLGVDLLTLTDYYKETYAEAQEQNRDEYTLPNLYEQITLVSVTSTQWRSHFHGFQRFGPGNEYILIKKSEESKLIPVKLTKLSQIIDSQGNVNQVEILRELLWKRKIPTVSSLLVSCDDEIVRVPIDEIDMIRWHPKKKGALTLFAVGACIDVILILYSVY